MGNWDLAEHQRRDAAEALVKCPRCGATNAPDQPKQIHIDVHNTAFCTGCKHEWDL